MFYLLWSILNAVLLLYFFYLFIGLIVNGREVFRGKFMPISILVLTLGVVQMLSASVSEEKNTEILITENYNEQSETEYRRIVLEDNLASDIELVVNYSVEDGKLIPFRSRCHLTGFVLGFEWEFISLDTYGTKEIGHPDFVAVGSLEWNLFGFNIYTQNKSFTGKMP